MEPIAPERAEGIWKAVESSLPELRPWMAWAPTAGSPGEAGFHDVLVFDLLESDDRPKPPVLG